LLLSTLIFFNYIATPIPIAKPASSGMGGIVAFLLLLALLEGEYYFLTTRDALLHPPPRRAHRMAKAIAPKVPVVKLNGGKRQANRKRSAVVE
jgi:hypothetical protein